MQRLNRRGFTLIELLAVIIILGVLLLIAVPAMTGVIENSKKDGFVSNAKQFISGVRYNAIQNSPYGLPQTKGTVLVVHTSSVQLDQGSHKSPYNLDMAHSYVYILNRDGQYVYYYAGRDTAGNCLTFTEESKLERKNVTTQTALGTDCTIPGISSGDNTIGTDDVIEIGTETYSVSEVYSGTGA